jgi:hypothetical protein
MRPPMWALGNSAMVIAAKITAALQDIGNLILSTKTNSAAKTTRRHRQFKKRTYAQNHMLEVGAIEVCCLLNMS